MPYSVAGGSGGLAAKEQQAHFRPLIGAVPGSYPAPPSPYSSIDLISPNNSPSRRVNCAAAAPLMAR